MLKSRYLFFIVFLLIAVVACGGNNTTTETEPQSNPTEAIAESANAPAENDPVANEVEPTSAPQPTEAAAVTGDTEPAEEAEPEPATAEPAAETPAGTATNFDPAGYNPNAGDNFIVLDNPEMVTAVTATWLEPDEIVLGVEQNGEAHAYPISQMVYHHLANTTIGGEPYLVTY